MLTFQRRLITARLIVTQIIVIVVFGIIQGQVVGYDLFEGNSCRLKDGSLGVCTKFPDCQSLYYGVIHRTIPYSDVVRCSFIGTTEVVCCGDRKPEITRPTTTKFPTNNKIIFTTTPQSVNIPGIGMSDRFIENEHDLAMLDKEINSNDALHNYDEKANPMNYVRPDVESPPEGNIPAMPEGIDERTSINIGGLQLSFQNNGFSNNRPNKFDDQSRVIPNTPTQHQRCNVAYDQGPTNPNPSVSVGPRFGIFNWRNSQRTTPRSNSPLSPIINIIKPIKDIPKTILTSITNRRVALDSTLQINYNSPNNPSGDSIVSGNPNYDPCTHEDLIQSAPPNSFDNYWQDDGYKQPFPTSNTPLIQQPPYNPVNEWGNGDRIPSESFSQITPTKIPTPINIPPFEEPVWNYISNERSTLKLSSDNSGVRPTPKASLNLFTTTERKVQRTTPTNTNSQENTLMIIESPILDPWMTDALLESSTPKNLLVQKDYRTSTMAVKPYVEDDRAVEPADTFVDTNDNNNFGKSTTSSVLDPWMQQALANSYNISTTTTRTTTKSPQKNQDQLKNSRLIEISSDDNPVVLDSWMKEALDATSNSASTKVKQNRTQKDVEWYPSANVPIHKSPAIENIVLDPWMKEALDSTLNSTNTQVRANRTTKDIEQRPFFTTSTTKSPDLDNNPVLDPWMQDALSASSSTPKRSTPISTPSLTMAEDSKLITGTKQIPTNLNVISSSLPRHRVIEPWMEQQQSQTSHLTTKSPNHAVADNTVATTVRSISGNAGLSPLIADSVLDTISPNTDNSFVSPLKRESKSNSATDRPNFPNSNINKEQPTDNSGRPSVLRRPSTNSDSSKNIRDNNDIYPSTDDSGTPDPRLDKKETESRGSGGKADVACAEYKKDIQVSLTYHILDGTNTTLGEFPHMAALGYPSTAAGRDVEWNCGGSLISDRFVMTAAHCINDNGPTVIRLGKVTIDSELDGADPVDMDVNEIILHPMYKNSRQYDDIALIRLNQPVEFTDYVRPACLNTDLNDIPPETVVVVTGWGLISLNVRTKSHILLKANLTTVDLAECNQTHADYHRNRKLPQGLNQGHLCAYDRELKKDTCEGDSGGPLQIVDRSGISIVYGVTSFGISCASMIPAVYARVSSYIDWIEPIVWP